MTRESISEDVANASRLGTFGLDEPGDHATDGRLVASTGESRRRGPFWVIRHDRVLDIARRGHHQVGQLVHDGQEVRVGPIFPLAARWCGDLPPT